LAGTIDIAATLVHLTEDIEANRSTMAELARTHGDQRSVLIRFSQHLQRKDQRIF
jgi:hypothetical protein